MFASCSTSEDYHLMRTSNSRTLRGLLVATIIIDDGVNTEYLDLTNESPADKDLCPQCATIDPLSLNGKEKSGSRHGE